MPCHQEAKKEEQKTQVFELCHMVANQGVLIVVQAQVLPTAANTVGMDNNLFPLPHGASWDADDPIYLQTHVFATVSAKT